MVSSTSGSGSLDLSRLKSDDLIINNAADWNALLAADKADGKADGKGLNGKNLLEDSRFIKFKALDTSGDGTLDNNEIVTAIANANTEVGRLQDESKKIKDKASREFAEQQLQTIQDGLDADNQVATKAGEIGSKQTEAMQSMQSAADQMFSNGMQKAIQGAGKAASTPSQ